MRCSRVILVLPVVIAAGLILAPTARSAPSELDVGPTPHKGAVIRHEAVKVSDLNLNSPDGAETLLGRIRTAARRVCSPSRRSRAIREVTDYQNCRNEAVARAVRQSGSPMLQQVFERTGD